jgi:Asp-tRNA(Asn)/Glu-tRNA(Gln) amidotransferase A subunit family amidase
VWGANTQPTPRPGHCPKRAVDLKTNPAWAIKESPRRAPQESYLDWMRSAYHVTVLGAAALSVPAGFTPDGLPIGLQIVTRPRSDLLTLQAGAAFEAATRHGRRRPGICGMMP